MKRIVMLATAVALSGCGIEQATKDTLAEVRKSNGTQDSLLGTSGRLEGLTGQLVTGMNITNNGVHAQTLEHALSGLIAPHNTEVLTPPARMMPFASSFTKEATASEIIQTFHAYLTDAKRGIPTLRAGEVQNADTLRIRSRNVSLTAAGLIAAFTPKEKFEEILNTQIIKNDRYLDTAYAFALCRYEVTRDWFFDAIVVNTETLNLGALRTAVSYYKSMKSVAILPYADKLTFKVPQFRPQADPMTGAITYVTATFALDRAELLRKAEEAATRFNDELPEDVKNSAEYKVLISQLK